MRRLLFALPILMVLLVARPGHATRPEVTVPEDSLGICFIYHDAPVWHDLARDAGPSFNRWQLSWYEVEAVKGRFDWSAFDPRVDMDMASGLTVSAILMGTPSWAATRGTSLAPLIKADVKEEPWTIRSLGKASTSASPPANLYLPWDHPDNYWGRFVYQTVSHFRDKIKIWEIWNEEDMLYFWSGSKADYYQLLKVAYQAAKAADAGCTVLFGGLHLFVDPSFFQDVLELARQDPGASNTGYYFDVLPLHLYSRSSQTYDTVRWVRWRLALKGIDKPIWINETGVPVWDDGVGPGYRYEWSATREEQADYMIQAYANALAAGVDKVFVFRLHDAGASEAYGLVKSDGSHRPSLAAFRTMQTYLRDAEWVTRQMDRGVVIVTLYGAAHGKVNVLWNQQPVATTYALPAVMDSALKVSREGTAERIGAQDGQYVLSLPGATASRVGDPNDYIIGGRPVIVIEPDTTAPNAAVHALPDITRETSFTVEWSGYDDASGIWSYDIQVRDGMDDAWGDWILWTSRTSATFEGQAGHTYHYRVRARDRAGNEGSYPEGAQAWTTVDLSSPTTPALTPTAALTDTPTATPSPSPVPPTATAVPLPVPCTEVLQNGGFEGDDHWTIYNTAYPARYVSQPPYAGSRVLQTGIEAAGLNVYSFSSAEQTVALPEGDRFTLRYWYRAQIAPGDHAYVFLRPEGGNWQILQILKETNPAWVQATHNLDVQAGQTVTLRFGTFNNGREDVSAMYVDEASIQACTGEPSPTPSATATPAVVPSPSPTLHATDMPLPTVTATPTALPATATVTSSPSPEPTATPSPSTACTERVANGDFEVGEAWIIPNTAHMARYSTITAYSGMSSLELGIRDPGADTFSYSSAEQRIDVPAGQTATLSLRYNVIDDGGDGDFGYLLLRPDGAAWQILRILHERTDGWQTLTADVSPYAGSGFTLRLGTRNDGIGDGRTAVMYVDAVSVQSCRR